MKEMIKKFFKTLKDYINYLMKVDFKELFINTVILICIVILSAFVYIPVGMIKDLLHNLLSIFISFNNIFGLIFIWIFNLISAILAILAFMYLFTKRFESIKYNKDQTSKKENTKDKDKENLDLPKVKE